MTTNVKKPTKKEKFLLIKSIISYAEQNGATLSEDSNCTFADLCEAMDHEVELLDAKTASAQKRAADRKAEGDELREKIFNVLSTEDFMTNAEILKALGDPDVSAQMVTSRVSQLVDLERVEKEMVSVAATTEGGKARKLAGYRRVG